MTAAIANSGKVERQVFKSSVFEDRSDRVISNTFFPARLSQTRGNTVISQAYLSTNNFRSTAETVPSNDYPDFTIQHVRPSPKLTRSKDANDLKK